MTLRHGTTATDRLLNQNWRVMGDNNERLTGSEIHRTATFQAYYHEPVTVARERIRGRFEFTLN